MTNTQPTSKSKDPTQQRIERLERTVNALHYHLVTTLELTYALAAELAKSNGRKQSQDATCTKILAEWNTIKGLNPISLTQKR
ncbi:MULTISPECIES: hypothetical protein [unclassified Nostoc]|uniref:hypothetical protein n=1 Tax=unclassified Nostoc TaxID=2593658 RepID=UPI002AD2C3B1|nr:hypothetical protein [Nostoc sp. DedQUE03]MDZ7974035.1 hypothetical protein [Nostoc sp. DedQUE03]MDZ8048536.1 hypothetical protein [Nostoc sp. DedQUE02]